MQEDSRRAHTLYHTRQLIPYHSLRRGSGVRVLGARLHARAHRADEARKVGLALTRLPVCRARVFLGDAEGDALRVVRAAVRPRRVRLTPMPAPQRAALLVRLRRMVCVAQSA